MDIMHELRLDALKAAYWQVFHEVMGHSSVVQRLDRAYEILTRSNEYSINITSKSPLMFSISSPKDTYAVDPGERTCTCPDSQQGNVCKHRLVVRIIIAAFALLRSNK